MEIENVLIRLREATTEINRATDDPRMKVTMEKSWLLQDRLVISDIVSFRDALRCLTFELLLTSSYSLTLVRRAEFVLLVISNFVACFMSHGRQLMVLMVSI